MRILKILSIAGLAWYPAWFIIGALAPNAGAETLHFLSGLASAAFFLYAIFHAVFGCYLGAKEKKAVLKIASIVSCVIFCIFVFFSVLTVTGLMKGDAEDWTLQSAFFGMMVFTVPFAIALSVITLIQSSKALKFGSTGA